MKSPAQTLYEELTRTNTGGGVPSLARCEAAAEAVLSSLWRSVSEPPEKEEFVLCGGGDKLRYVARLGSIGNSFPGMTHWMPIPPLPTPGPTPEEKELAEFEAWIISQGGKPGVQDSETEAIKTVMWLGWQGAREAKEGAKP